MAGEQPKKRVCRVCETEHKVGEPCPNCEWDEEKEQLRAKGAVEREKLVEEEREKTKPKPKKTNFWGN